LSEIKDAVAGSSGGVLVGGRAGRQAKKKGRSEDRPFPSVDPKVSAYIL
jgi:hypothetical protein